MISDDLQSIIRTNDTHLIFSGLFFHVVGEGVVNLSKKAESVTDRESYIDFRLRLLGEQGMHFLKINNLNFVINVFIAWKILLRFLIVIATSL